MGIVDIVLLLLGIAALVYGVVLAIRRAWAPGIILLVIGLILLAVGGFVHIDV